jgi:hypothetical protein
VYDDRHAAQLSTPSTRHATKLAGRCLFSAPQPAVAAAATVAWSAGTTAATRAALATAQMRKATHEYHSRIHRSAMRREWLESAVLAPTNPLRRTAAESGAVRPSGGFHALSRQRRAPGEPRHYCESHRVVDGELRAMGPTAGLRHVDSVNARHTVHGGVYLTVGSE